MNIRTAVDEGFYGRRTACTHRSMQRRCAIVVAGVRLCSGIQKRHNSRDLRVGVPVGRVRIANRCGMKGLNATAVLGMDVGSARYQ